MMHRVESVLHTQGHHWLEVNESELLKFIRYGIFNCMVMPKWLVNKVWVRLIITTKAWVDTIDGVGCLSA